MMNPHDETWMRRAMQLAEAGRGYAEPNPMVGGVIVRDGKVVGEGWHRKFGEAHAEINALAAARDAGRGETPYVMGRAGKVAGEGWHRKFGEAHAEINALAAAGDAARGATLYVTLEPCCHHGKTPPCTDAVLRAGIERVVAAMPDPFPQVAGRGASLLRAAGVTVELGLCEAEARRLNAPYLKL